MIKKIPKYLNSFEDVSPLVMFRILFGFIMLVSLVRFWNNGWIESIYIDPEFHFKYYGFEWVKSLGKFNYLLFIICSLSSICIMIGYKYVYACILFFLSFTYIELIDKTTYLNHYYFISVVSFLMIFLPANIYFSIDSSRKKFKSLPPEDISFPRSASDVVKYQAHSTIYAKGTPIHIRGALLYNYYVKKHKLDNKYSLIQNGEKIKFCYLKKPNIIHENIISFIQDFPRELGLDKYVDYDLQFDKSFLEPLKIILDAIGWNVEKTVNLELFFS